ncbi:MAG: hypothetical protein KF887_06735 [Paracoccaceae bacterium]|nr:MAG: hypothetical protein KF887_06735 [Paracoccaceae bacterium]
MTALAKYQRLEARGLWRDLPEAQRREVVVNLGQASLVLSDPRSDTAITHWSLPAVRRLNPGEMPALFAPGEDAGETLELQDRDMVDALETVHAALLAARPRPGRLRGAILGALVLGVMAVGVTVLPGAILNHTASVLPQVTRAEIGAMALADLSRLTGAPCAAGRGSVVLAGLADRLFPGPARVTLVVVREGVHGAVALPGRRVILSEALLAEADGPDLLAGAALSARSGAEVADPVLPILRHAGLMATFRLLTTGSIAPDEIAGYAERLLQEPPANLPPDTLLDRFRAAGVPSSPWAYFRDPTGEAVLPLIEADPFPAGAPRPLLPDEDWIALQDICET